MSVGKASNPIKQALQVYSRKDLSNVLGVEVSTLREWEKSSDLPLGIVNQLSMLFPDKSNQCAPEFTFIDLFAGIGGIRTAFERLGGECVFTSEWDKFAQKSYKANHKDNHQIDGDITKIDASKVPDHDVLLAGFPCQPFSIAGVSKKNHMGRAHGFDDETQGTLFFDVVRVLREKRPKAFLLENVKNLTSHDQGRTFEVICRKLQEDLGYHIHYKVLDGAHFKPQNRERIIIVGFRENVDFSWDLASLPKKGSVVLGDILHKTDGSEPFLPWDGQRFFDHEGRAVQERYNLTPKLWEYLQNYAAKHKAKGNGFGFGLVNEKSITRTLSARYYKDGSEILVDQGMGRNPRRLTPRECARLMGYPDTFRIVVSDTQAYKQFGNSVVVDVIEFAAKKIVPHILPVA